MGLDHGLYRKRYVKNWEHMKPEQRHRVAVEKNGKQLPKSQLDLEKVAYITEEIITWRKANQIHNWFVQNVQEGVDDCKDAYVELDQLKSLLAVIRRVLKSSRLVKGKVYNGTRYKGGIAEDIMDEGQVIEDPSVAAELLPTTPGFFFGSTGYDEYYIANLERTLEVLAPVVDGPDDNDVTYEYWSSW